MKKAKTKVFKINYYDSDGKRRGKTFSAPTMAEARIKAAEWERTRPTEKKPSMAVLDAVAQYIELKRPVWSPSTTRSLLCVKKSRIEDDEIGKADIFTLNSADLQAWVSRLTAAGVALKTIRNAYGLLLPAVKMFRPDAAFTVTFPQKKKQVKLSPSSNDVKALLDYIKGRYGEGSDLEISILLASTCTLRRGEVCALTAEDIRGNTVHVCKSMVFSDSGEWIIKPPKTAESDRIVTMPEALVKLLKGRQGKLVHYTPTALSAAFEDAVVASGVPRMRFHDLRHYSVSVLHAMGVPDVYLLHRGGWSSPHVLRSVYRNEISDERKKQDEKIAGHFDSIF